MQDGLKDCGICSLLTIIENYGGRVSKEYLRILTNTTKNGTNLKNLKDAAIFLGFEVKALNGDIKNMDKTMLPCISHVIINKSYKHFIVINEINKNDIIVSDPNKGVYKISIEEYNKISTNNYLILKPNKPIPNQEYNNSVLQIIKTFIYKYKSTFFSIFIFSLFYTFFNIVTSYQFQISIEDAITYFSYNNLYFITTIFLILTILKYISNYSREYLFNYINHKLDITLFKDIYKYIISLPYLYYKNRTTGEIISRINDLSTVKETLSNIFIYVFVDSILTIFVLINLCMINKKLTIFSLIILLIYFIVVKTFSKVLNKNINNTQEKVSQVNSYLVESIENATTIKNLNVENNIIDKMLDKYKSYLKSSYKFNKIFNLENFILSLLEGIFLCLIIFIGSLLVLKDKMTVGELITYNSLLIYFLEPLKNIINSSLYINKSKISIKRIIDLYNIPKEKLEYNNKYLNNNIDGSIDIRKLNFSYNGQKNILNNINMSIKNGERVLIYGNSGCGKSTLSKILLKYIDINNEMIYISNKDINDYNLVDLRNNITYVSQNEMLFTDSIYNNIILNREIDYNSFLDVCMITKTNDIVKDKMNKYDMLLEENGFNLSGGERQKIVLSRALLKQSKIYILDEALSQVDINNEREILNNIFKKYKDITFIIISHRFNNNDLFDKTYNLGELNG